MEPSDALICKLLKMKTIVRLGRSLGNSRDIQEVRILQEGWNVPNVVQQEQGEESELLIKICKIELVP